MFEQVFQVLCSFPNFFSQIKTIHFVEMFAKMEAITYIDDVILQAKTKAEVWKTLECLRSSGLKAAPYKTKLFLTKIRLLGHTVSDKGIQSVAKRVQVPKYLKSPENKRGVLRVFRSSSFYSTFIKILHVVRKPFYELFTDDVPFNWTREHEKFFENRITEKSLLAEPNAKYLLCIMLIHPASVLDPSWYKSSPVKTSSFIQISSVHKKWTEDVHSALWTLWNILRATNIWAFHYRLFTSDRTHLWSQAAVVPEGTKSKIISTVFPLSNDYYRIHKPSNLLNCWKRTLIFLTYWAEMFPWRT